MLLPRQEMAHWSDAVFSEKILEISADNLWKVQRPSEPRNVTAGRIQVSGTSQCICLAKRQQGEHAIDDPSVPCSENPSSFIARSTLLYSQGEDL